MREYTTTTDASDPNIRNTVPQFEVMILLAQMDLPNLTNVCGCVQVRLYSSIHVCYMFDVT